MLNRQTVSQVIVEYLISEKIPYILGIFGHGNIQLGEALRERANEITFIQVKNEQNAVHIATAYAKHTGKPLAVTTSIGPGATNLVTGAACAHINRLPVLLLPGDAFSDNTGPVLQQIEGNSDVDALANECLKPVSVYWKRITNPEQLQKALPEAFDRMLQPGNEGPAVLCLPMDIQAEECSLDIKTLMRPRDTDWQRFSPDERALKKAVDLIVKAKRPLIIAGGGVIRSEAWIELQDFIEYTKIPVVQTHAGNGSLLFHHPLNLFSVGPSGSDCGNHLAEKADLIIGIGTRYTDFTTSSKTLFRQDAKFINLNISHTDVGKERAVKLYGDAKKTLVLLLNELRKNIFDKRNSYLEKRSSYLEEIEEVRTKWIKYTTKWRTRNDTPISQSSVIGIVNNYLQTNDVIVCAAGSLPGDLLRLWRIYDPTRKNYHLEYGYSTMGYEISGGIGVKLADPNRNIFVIVGDGSFLMASQDLVTAVQECIAITVILLDNHGHRSIEGCQKFNSMQPFATEYRMRNKKTNTLSDAFIPIDFKKIAEGYGCYVLEAKNKKQLKFALYLATIEKNKPTVIYVPTNPNVRFETQGSGGWWDVPVPANLYARKHYIKQKSRQVIR